MGWRLSTDAEQRLNGQVSVLRTDLAVAVTRLEHLEASMRILKLEWEDAFDKMSNANKRQRMRERREPEPSVAADGLVAGKPSLDSISEAIRLRRGGRVIQAARSVQG